MRRIRFKPLGGHALRYLTVTATVSVCLAVPGLATAAVPVIERVPAPTPDTSVITVKTGGDRTGPGTDGVAGLAGVTLALFDDEDASDPIGEDWAECVSDGDGDCSFVVPVTGADSGNLGRRFWVRQLAAPSGWVMNPQLRVGPGSGSNSIAADYQFETPPLVADETYYSTSDFMYSTSNSLLTSSLGIWQQTRANPPLPARCGIDVAVVLDLSASVGGQLPNLKRTADTLTDALTGTPSRMAVFSFSADSPSVGTQNHPEPLSVSTEADAAEFKAQYADWPLGAGTNWDQALWRVADADPVYDVAIVITDGNPTRYSTDPVAGDGSRTHFRDVEAGVFSANALKAEGTPIVAMGVGTGVSGVTGLNLAAISGPEKYDGTNVTTADYYQESSYKAAGQALRELVARQCEGTLSVIKQIVPSGNSGDDVSDSENAGAGWEFTGTSPQDIGGLPSTQTTTDDGTGSVNFDLTYPAGVTSAEVTVAEAQQDGHTLVTPDGANAVCTDLVTGAPVAIVNGGTTERPSFTVNVDSGAAISCLVYNRPLEAAEVTVDKVWLVDDTEYRHGDQPAGLDATLTLTGPGEAPASTQPWGTTRDGFTSGETTTVDERVEITDDTCRFVSSAVTEADGRPIDEALPYTATLSEGDNHYTVTNRIECGAQLTLVKQLDRGTGTADPTDWTLRAEGPQSISGTSGGATVTDVWVPVGEYRLSESDGPRGYRAGEWECSAANGTVPSPNDTVGLERGDRVECVITNVHVDDSGDGDGGPDGLPVTGDSVVLVAATGLLGAGLIAAGMVAILRLRRWNG
ncbi:VWA domain-containing protein [Stackebrandtia endophytica]|nr:VWA domain-containing protein [Stackebrandtia endophytica]